MSEEYSFGYNAGYQEGYNAGYQEGYNAAMNLMLTQLKTWVGLTDEELAKFSEMKLGAYDLCLEVEAKLKEKNT